MKNVNNFLKERMNIANGKANGSKKEMHPTLELSKNISSAKFLLQCNKVVGLHDIIMYNYVRMHGGGFIGLRCKG